MENLSRAELLTQLMALQEENISLRQENKDLSEMLEAVTEHSDNVSADLRHQAAILAETYQRMQDDLALARQIQYGLLSPSRPAWPQLEVICYTKSATEVGGDFYAYHAFSDNHLALAVGDVSGKGVSAALIMATCLSLFQTSLLYPMTPSERLIYLDKMLMPYSQFRNQNCAMSYVEVEIRSKESTPDSQFPMANALLHIVNAGCIPPYIKRVNGEIENPEICGFALGQGLGAESGYEQVIFQLNQGDTIILVSDGVVEAFNINGDMLGFQRLEQIIKNIVATSAEEMLDQLKQAIFDFTGEAEHKDDITIIVACMW